MLSFLIRTCVSDKKDLFNFLNLQIYSGLNLCLVYAYILNNYSHISLYKSTFTWETKWAHTSWRFQTDVKTSSVHMKFHFGWISKRPDILMDICRHFISGSVYMMFYHTKWNFIFVKIADMKSIPALSFKRTCTLNATSSLHLFISFRVNYVLMKISCRFEISFWSKWLMWSPYLFEFHFTSIHVNTSKELTEQRSVIFNWYEIPYQFELISPLMWTHIKK